ncbi:hypothetical protein [Halorussus pelagicus]|nr:hypothetical protein [Halorussus pelagicus]
MNWADLFERAAESETDVETIRATLDARRENAAEDPEEGDDA